MSDGAPEPAREPAPTYRWPRVPRSMWRGPPPADDRELAREATLAGRTVRIDEDCVPFVGTGCVACPNPGEVLREVAPGPYGIFGHPKGGVRPFSLRFCQRCGEEQASWVGRYSPGWAVKFWIAMGCWRLWTGSAPGAFSISMGTVWVALDLVACWWPFAPIYVTHSRAQGEVVFRFRRVDAARRFASENGAVPEDAEDLTPPA